ncbi:hypothetical protein [Planktotalea arctica]|uniref:hypothetical protein n=1 Tax=Planktotalea arctica TaxID=1481893 RepID=UPI000A16EC68|nr:hypothetical protein [Planktotalea arctica]
MSEQGKEVHRRRVFYIPGYDPFHPRRYRELYRKESAAQAEITGYEIGLKPKQGKGPYGWHVSALIDGAQVESEIEVLYWADMVKVSMNMGIASTYGVMAQTAWTYISTGALWRLMRLRKGPVIAALYPVGFLLVQASLAWLAAYGIAQGVQTILPSGVGAALGWGLGALLAYGILDFFRRKDNKFFAYYLMHDYAYSARTRGANPAELEVRMGEFVTRIGEAMEGDADEVLVIGHSSGAHIGVSVLADLLRAKGMQEAGPELSFLTLGQVVPMVSFLPEAWRLRADLAYMASQDRPFWVDVTAPGDGCAFALCDPVSVSGVAPQDKKQPLVFSAAFTQSLSPERWRELRWKFFRLHFQYLCAFDAPKDYDYFQITAGPQTLLQRYGTRVPSKSRIEAPVNRFTSLAP